MPLCCQTISIGLGIFCHCQAFSVELEKSFSGPLCALPLCNSPHEWKCPKFTCDFAYSVAWKPRPFFRPAWQYLCLGWCQIFSPLKLCAVSSSTDLCIKKVTTRVGFCLVAASLDPPLGWKFLWIYMGEYPSRCMPPPTGAPHGMTQSGPETKHGLLPWRIESPGGAGCNDVDRKRWQPANLRMVSTTKNDTS